MTEQTLPWGAEVASVPQDFAEVRGKTLAFLNTPQGDQIFNFPLLQIQKKAVAHMMGLRYSLLFDDMGLGKTIQALAVSTLAKSHKTVIFCPNNIKKVWYAEITNFTHSSPAEIYIGRADDLLAMPEIIISRFQYLIFNYETLRVAGKAQTNPPPLFREADHIILDEAHRFRNSLTQDFLSFRRFTLQAPPRLMSILTGTPIDRFLGEMWSYLILLDQNPAIKEKRFSRYFPSQEHFNDRYAILKSTTEKAGKTVMKWGGFQEKAYPEIKQMVGARVIRRVIQDIDNLPKLTKADIQLPDSYFPEMDWEEYQTRFTSAHRIIEAVNRKKKPNEKELDAIQILQKLRVEIATRKSWYSFHQAKNMLTKGQLVLFSEFLAPLRWIEKWMADAGLPTLLVYGKGMPLHERDRNIQKFKDGEAPLLMATFHSMSEGENLQHCNQMLFNDLPWQVLVAQQAQRRVWRIGQKRPCTHVTMLCGGDQFVIDVVFKKTHLIELLYEDFRSLKEEYGLGK